MTDEQIAAKMNIHKSTLYDWLNKYSELSDALKKGKAPVDIEVENALLKRALGYDYEETTTEAYGDEKKHIRKVTKHMPPEPAAMFFWLKNRRPDKWREKPVEPQKKNEILENLIELMESAKKDEN